LFVRVKVSCALPAAIPAELAAAFKTPVEQRGTEVVAGGDDVVGVETVVGVVVAGGEVVVGLEEPNPQPSSNSPEPRTAAIRQIALAPLAAEN
jgi:hypothetical protein